MFNFQDISFSFHLTTNLSFRSTLPHLSGFSFFQRLQLLSELLDRQMREFFGVKLNQMGQLFSITGRLDVTVDASIELHRRMRVGIVVGSGK